MTTETPPFKELMLSFLGPLFDFIAIFNHGIHPTWQYMCKHPLSIFSLSTWRSQLIDSTQPWLMDLVDQSWAPVKSHIIKPARGVVLEIGAGTGENLKYYRLKKIERIYVVEPNSAKCALLREKSEELGMKEKVVVVPRGIEKLDEATLGSIDTVVCVRPS